MVARPHHGRAVAHPRGEGHPRRGATRPHRLDDRQLNLVGAAGWGLTTSTSSATARGSGARVAWVAWVWTLRMLDGPEVDGSVACDGCFYRGICLHGVGYRQNE